MASLVTAMKVFVASPGDVLEERKIVQDVLEELNTERSRRKIRLEFVGWEQVSPGMGPPQEVINGQISPRDCDLFIGIMWSRFGTPTEGFGSGTEEEFDQAYASWQHQERPRIFFYFCEKMPPLASKEQAEQYAKVFGFREKLANERGLIATYPEREGFRSAVRRHLARYLDELETPPHPDPLPRSNPTSAPPRSDELPAEQPRHFTVYLASVHDVLEPIRAGLIEKLSLRPGIEVFRPHPDPVVNRLLMQRAHVCIHLLDGSFHAVVDRQLDEGRAVAQRQLLWLSPRIELSPSDADPYHRKLLALKNGEGTSDFMQCRNAGAEILERVESLQEEWLRSNGRGIFFNTHGNDKSLAQEVFDYLMERQVEALMNEDDLGEPLKAFQEFDDKARRSRAIVVFFGAVNAAWVAARLMEIMKLVFTRGYAVDKLGVYAAPPPSKSKKEPIRLPVGFVPIWMDNTEGFDPRTLDDLL